MMNDEVKHKPINMTQEEMVEKKRKVFLDDLTQLMKKHKVEICLETKHGIEFMVADFEFDNEIGIIPSINLGRLITSD